MKKLFSTLLFCIIAFSAWAQIEKDPYKLSAVTEYDPDSPILYELLKNTWKKDYNGDPCALIRVKFENMPKDEIQNLSFNFSLQGKKEEARVDSLSSSRKELWLYVENDIDAIMEVTAANGTKSNRQSDIKFRSKHVYDVTLTCEKRQTINIRVLPLGATFKLDGDKASTGRFENVTYGTHDLEISIGGKLKKVTQIEVSDLSNSFEFDLREKKKIKIKTDPKGAAIKIDGKLLDEFSPTEVELAYGSYHIEAEIGLNESDEKTITVNEFTEEVVLNPIKRQAFEVSAMYQGRAVPADLYVNGEIYKDKNGNVQTGLLRYPFYEPVGTKLNLRMSYIEATAEKTIKVEQNMDVNQQFHIKPRNRITWWWQKEYNSKGGGFAIGYVQKQIETQGNGEKHLYNGIWPDGENKWLKGVQVGLYGQPAFSWGLGLKFGLYYELYMSTTKEYPLNDTYDTYMEHNLYAPLHLYYRFAFGKNVALKISGGAGCDYCFDSTFYDSEQSAQDMNGLIGEEGEPQKLNLSIEVGVGLRLGPFDFNAIYSKGISDHKLGKYPSENGYKTVRNKLALNVGFLF